MSAAEQPKKAKPAATDATIVVCGLCKVRPTFTPEGVCSACRNLGKKSGGVDVVSR